MNFFSDLLWYAEIAEPALPYSGVSIFRLATFGALVAAFLLVGCGRKGPLDLPPADTVQQSGEGQQAEGQRSAASGPRTAPPVQYNVDGRPLAPPGQKKKLPGDILID